ncbi:RCC1 domain-containing protein, partial [Oligoflexus tunisiensis]|uniref:RCC1 domain-containing protein n=1 Tax=Oligoflexus tunisiensis TaxID=708132 RepID=UPI00159F2616
MVRIKGEKLICSLAFVLASCGKDVSLTISGSAPEVLTLTSAPFLVSPGEELVVQGSAFNASLWMQLQGTRVDPVRIVATEATFVVPAAANLGETTARLYANNLVGSDEATQRDEKGRQYRRLPLIIIEANLPRYSDIDPNDLCSDEYYIDEQGRKQQGLKACPEILFDPPPPDPETPLSSSLSDSSILVYWTSGGGSTMDFRISYQTGDIAPASCSAGTTISESLIDGVKHVIEGLNPSTTYSFRICAINGNTDPDESSGVSTSTSTPLPGIPPNPVSLSLAPYGTSVRLSWTSGGGSTNGYRIAWLAGASAPPNCMAGVVVHETLINGTSHRIQGLSMDTQYSFRICAVNSKDNPDSSSGMVIQGMTQAHGPFIQAAVGSDHTCGLTSQGQVYCWGSNSGGELGDGSDVDADAPLEVDNTAFAIGERIGLISAGWSHTCAVSTVGNAYCWGDNSNGQLGDGSTTARSIPTAVDVSLLAPGERFTQVTGGDDHTCGLTSIGKAYCWGGNDTGQLGDGNSGVATDIPTSIDTSTLSPGEVFVSISAGNNHTCAITSLGRLLCWGDNSDGQLGDGSGDDQDIPALADTSMLATGERFVQISSGLGTHTCGLTSLGRALCWGDNNEGQLGTANDTAWDIPTAVNTAALSSGENFAQLGAGGGHSCGLTTLGRVFCWGDGFYGSLGTGDNASYYIPMIVQTSGMQPGEFFTQVSDHYSFDQTCGVSTLGRIFCWGADYFGQLGDGGSNMDQNAPSPVDTTEIGDEHIFTRITAGYDHGCGVTNLRNVLCWGSNENGQLGDGNTEDRNIPGSIDASGLATGERFMQTSLSKAADPSFSCGITSHGKTFCWGNGTYGQLGDGTNSSHGVPAVIDSSNLASNERFTELRTGAAH